MKNIKLPKEFQIPKDLVIRTDSGELFIRSRFTGLSPLLMGQFGMTQFMYKDHPGIKYVSLNTAIFALDWMKMMGMGINEHVLRALKLIRDKVKPLNRKMAKKRGKK